MDALDHKILALVQKNNLLTHQRIGQEIGLSPSAVRRRLALLRRNGTIAADVSIIRPAKNTVTVIVFIVFAKETPDIYSEFEKQLCALPEVKQFYHIAGDKDCMLIVNTDSLQAYEQWAITHIMPNEAIARYDSTVVWSCKKFDTTIPA
ncbi:MAG: Lrp/AsnC family transcriptional regulator [bacterium]